MFQRATAIRAFPVFEPEIPEEDPKSDPQFTHRILTFIVY